MAKVNMNNLFSVKPTGCTSKGKDTKATITYTEVLPSGASRKELEEAASAGCKFQLAKGEGLTTTWKWELEGADGKKAVKVAAGDLTVDAGEETTAKERGGVDPALNGSAK